MVFPFRSSALPLDRSDLTKKGRRSDPVDQQLINF
jgi:hypothetical protein